MRETDFKTRVGMVEAHFRRERFEAAQDFEVLDAIKARVLEQLNSPDEAVLTPRQRIDGFILKLIYRCADLFN